MIKVPKPILVFEVGPMPPARNIITPLIIACALFMENLDSSIISTALPTIASSLHTDPLHLNLAITSYMFSLAVFIPLSGWTSDRFGARTVFRAAIVVFTLGSILCGFSTSLLTLVLSRILQGLGGAMMVPVGRLVLLRTIEKKDLVNAMAWVTAPALVGPVLGPPIGGLIATYASWRWIFFVNIPIGVLGLVMATLYIENIRGRTREPLDVIGFLLMGLSLSGLVFGFETVGKHILPWPVVIAGLAAGIGCFGLYLMHVKRIEHPIVDLSILKYPTFRISVLGGSLFRISIGALPFLLPLMLQYGFGLSAARSGFLTFSSAAGAIGMKVIATRILRWLGFRVTLIGNALINVVFLMGCGLLFPTTPHLVIFLFLLVGGFFRALEFTALNTIAFAEVPPALMSRANTLYSMSTQLALSLGVALGALLLNFTLSWRGSAVLAAQDFWPAFVGIGLLSFAASLSFIPLAPEAAAEMSGHKIKLVTEVERKEPT